MILSPSVNEWPGKTILDPKNVEYTSAIWKLKGLSDGSIPKVKYKLYFTVCDIGHGASLDL